jgi:hypothetical protein
MIYYERWEGRSFVKRPQKNLERGPEFGIKRMHGMYFNSRRYELNAYMKA